jgi:hypothetical protein
MKNAVLWNVTQCGSYKNIRFGGTYCLYHKGEKNWRSRCEEMPVLFRSMFRRLLTANAFPSLPIRVTLMMESLYYYETSVFTRITQRNITKDSFLHSHRREILKSYIELTGWALAEM